MRRTIGQGDEITLSAGEPQVGSSTGHYYVSWSQGIALLLASGALPHHLPSHTLSLSSLAPQTCSCTCSLQHDSYLQPMFLWSLWVKRMIHLHLLLLSSSCKHKKSSIRLFMSCIQELLVLQSLSLVSLMILFFKKCCLSNNKGTATASEQ